MNAAADTAPAASNADAGLLPPGRVPRQLVLAVLALYGVTVLLGAWLVVRTLRSIEHERQSAREGAALQAASTLQSRLLYLQSRLHLFLIEPQADNRQGLLEAEAALPPALDALRDTVAALPGLPQVHTLAAQVREQVLARQQVLGSAALPPDVQAARRAVAAEVPRLDAIRQDLKALRADIERGMAQRRAQMETSLRSNAQALIAFGVVLMIALGLALRSVLRALGERRRLLARLEEEASLDASTRLPNRPYFHEWLTHAQQQAQADGTALALLRIEVQASGEPQLREAAARLAQTKRRLDVLGRIGPRSFGLIAPLHRLDVESRHDIAELALRLTDAVSQPGVRSQASAAVGVALYPADAADADALLAAAQSALARARDLPGRLPRVAFADDPDGAALQRTLRLRSDLPAALAGGQLWLAAQPEFAAADARVVGAEALVRWEHPEFGAVGPQEFLPLLARAGLLPRLTDWVLPRALDAVAQWRKLQPQMRVAVNVTRQDWLDPGFVQRVAAALAARNLPGAALELELSEEQSLGADCAQALRQVQALGVGLALDDFGVAASSLAALQRLPVQRVKIDRRFVARLPDNADDAQLLRGMLRLARGLGLAVTCEGLETPQQIALLRELGADELQGFGLARPMPLDAFSRWLDSGAPTLPAPA